MFILATLSQELTIVNNALAILIGAVIIAVAILIVFRWQLVVDVGPLLLDRWTGRVIDCEGDPTDTRKLKFKCE